VRTIISSFFALAWICNSMLGTQPASAQALAKVGDKFDTSGAALSASSIESDPGLGLSDLKGTGADALPSLSHALSRLSSDHLTTRGINDVRLYASASPGVVLVVTKDSLGSGSLITPEGLIVTNLHVVGTNRQVGVILKPRREGAVVTKADIRSATVIRRDQVADLALVQLDSPSSNLPTISLGSMDEVQVGADVHAIGHPTGEAWTYTKGIVSQVRQNYRWKAEDEIPHTALVIQTQTPINPGNSGGPLLSDRGDLVGVNSFKGQGEGLNFAVSVDDVRKIITATSDRMERTSMRTSSKKCEPKYYKKEPSADPPGTQQLIDFDCSGKPNAILIVPADPSQPILLQVDPKHTGKVTGVYVDEHRDGKWGISYWDTTNRGKADLKCYQTNADFNPTRCEKIEG
jgi:S1-C subfamily serine protease